MTKSDRFKQCEPAASLAGFHFARPFPLSKAQLMDMYWRWVAMMIMASHLFQKNGRVVPLSKVTSLAEMRYDVNIVSLAIARQQPRLHCRPRRYEPSNFGGKYEEDRRADRSHCVSRMRRIPPLVRFWRVTRNHVGN